MSSTSYPANVAKTALADNAKYKPTPARSSTRTDTFDRSAVIRGTRLKRRVSARTERRPTRRPRPTDAPQGKDGGNGDAIGG